METNRQAVGQIDSVMGSETVAAYFCFLSGLKQGYQWFKAGLSVESGLRERR